MKKVLISAICVLAVLLGILAVDAILTNKSEGNVTQGNYYTDGDVTETQSDTEAETEKSKDKDKNKDKDKDTTERVTKDRNATVNFTMPLYYLEEKYQNDLDAFCKDNNYIACTIDTQAQTFTVTMNALTHDLMLINVGIQSIKNMANVIESEKYPFFKELNKYNDDFSEITVLVDKAAYTAQNNDRESFTAYIAGCGIYYQLYTESNDYSCKVTVKDKDSDEILDTKTYKQNNSGVVSN